MSQTAPQARLRVCESPGKQWTGALAVAGCATLASGKHQQHEPAEGGSSGGPLGRDGILSRPMHELHDSAVIDQVQLCEGGLPQELLGRGESAQVRVWNSKLILGASQSEISGSVRFSRGSRDLLEPASNRAPPSDGWVGVRNLILWEGHLLHDNISGPARALEFHTALDVNVERNTKGAFDGCDP